ncbi:hypothetical protein ACO22_04375 [Paracoccidioides brasiliensis]|uniref:Uncharacterized protein n=1 Tax=Paracoccidioides brasiliensis TaxID=121759 RepID=A0A1D2JDA8_PARBR|nr:hypothetical protein ACO22_04375 [Paracoccidioides brasiliensis]
MERRMNFSSPSLPSIPLPRRNHSLAGYHGLASDRTKYSGSFLPLDGKHGQVEDGRTPNHHNTANFIEKNWIKFRMFNKNLKFQSSFLFAISEKARNGLPKKKKLSFTRLLNLDLPGMLHLKAQPASKPVIFNPMIQF